MRATLVLPLLVLCVSAGEESLSAFEFRTKPDRVKTSIDLKEVRKGVRKRDPRDMIVRSRLEDLRQEAIEVLRLAPRREGRCQFRVDRRREIPVARRRTLPGVQGFGRFSALGLDLAQDRPGRASIPVPSQAALHGLSSPVVVSTLEMSLRLAERDLDLVSIAHFAIPTSKAARERQGTREFAQIMQQRDEPLEHFHAARLRRQDLFVGRGRALLESTRLEIAREFEKRARTIGSVQVGAQQEILMHSQSATDRALLAVEARECVVGVEFAAIGLDDSLEPGFDGGPITAHGSSHAASIRTFDLFGLSRRAPSKPGHDLCPPCRDRVSGFFE